MAQQALGSVAYTTHWLEGDLLAWAQGDLDGGTAGSAAPPSTDILHSAFAIHHLDDHAKVAFLQAARRRMSPGGLFLWVDVFREPGESREAYVARYTQRIQQGWPQLTAGARDQPSEPFRHPRRPRRHRRGCRSGRLALDLDLAGSAPGRGHGRSAGGLREDVPPQLCSRRN
jgi:hypothetical protein